MFLERSYTFDSLLSSMDGILEMQSQFLEQMQTLASREELEKTLDRPGFVEIIQQLEQGKTAAVFVKDLCQFLM